MNGKENQMSCVYLGKDTGRKTEQLGTPIYECQLNETCVLDNGTPQHAACDTCKKKLLTTDKEFSVTWEDPLHVYDRHMQLTTAIRNTLAGRSVFLVGGGPSLNALPLDRLYERGMWSMAVNNVAGHGRFRPQAFVCSDPPSKFSHCVWLDPGIMKFFPHTKAQGGRAGLRRKLPSGVFEPLGKATLECPNVWPVRRRSWMSPDDTFFLDTEASIGNFDSGRLRTKEPKTVCTLLYAMRILRYLGAGQVFLLGVDFHMQPQGGYSFAQSRSDKECDNNNRQFGVVNNWLTSMEQGGVFNKFGIRFFNCNRTSGLRAFPYVPFEVACQHVTNGIEQKPDLAEWYLK